MAKKEGKKKFQMPHIYVILFTFSALAAISTYFIPAGQFDRVPGPDGRETVDPNSFTQIESDPVGIIDFLTVIPRGLIDAGEIVFFTFIVGGMFMVLRTTGIIEIVVDRLANRFAKQSILLIPILMTVFAVVATLIGTPELSLVYIPVILPLMIALGYDSLVAAGIALMGTVIGFTAGVLNPINVGLSQKIVGLPVFSGIGLRIVLFVVLLTIGILFLMRYAKKVQKDPLKNSFVYEDDVEKRELYKNKNDIEVRSMNTRQKLGSIAALLFLLALVYGVLYQGWFMVEMAGLFIFMGIVVGKISGLNATEISEAFTKGFREVLMGAIIIGLARSVAVVLEDGMIMDTIVNSLGSIVGEMPSVLGAVGMFLAQLAINFVIPSGSGQALVTMPIMGPLADIIGVTRQTAVLAFQVGDGFAHILFPTSGYFMAALVIAGVPWQKWIKFYLPVFLVFSGIGIVALIFAQLVQWTG